MEKCCEGKTRLFCTNKKSNSNGIVWKYVFIDTRNLETIN